MFSVISVALNSLFFSWHLINSLKKKLQLETFVVDIFGTFVEILKVCLSKGHFERFGSNPL